MKRLVIIDGKSVFYRGYYAMPNLSTREGTPTGGVFGFASLSLELMKKLKPDYVAVAWDKKGTNIRKRREIYPEYKAGRKPAPPDFYDQIPILYELLEAFGWPLYELDDYEADDIMGAFADQASKQGIETCLITSDLDALQLLGERTHVYAMKKGLANIEQFDVAHFEKKYGIHVEQFLDLKSLKGDGSDNIPGVPGVGEKTAITLLQEYKTLDSIYENLELIKESVRKKLVAGKDSAYMSKELGRIWIDAPINLDLQAANAHDLDTAKLRQLLQRLEFRSLLNRLPDHMQDGLQGSLFASAQATDDLESATEHLFDKKALASLQVAPQLVVAKQEYRWLISDSKDRFYVLNDEQVLTLFSSEAAMIAHDAKLLLKDLLKIGMKDIHLPRVLHDTRQASFLINSLSRTRSLDDQVGVDLTNDTGAKTIAAVWSVFAEQKKTLASLPQVAKVAHEIDFPLITVLARMEYFGVKIDTNFFDTMNKKLGEKLDALHKEVFAMVGYEFNMASPMQLAEVLFTKLQLPTKGIKKGKTGYSTGQKELDKLRGQHPIIELIEQTREYAKLKNTYVDTLPKIVDENNRLHTTFNQDVAATGRLSSTEPNLQNIPIRSEVGRKIREGFIADAGHVLVSADYSQFELRLAAVLANDAVLIEDFNSDLDVHTKTASDVYGIPIDQVTKNQRRDAKVINFGVLYGMSPHGLSAATGMTFSQAKDFIAHYFELRAPIRKYIDATLEKARDEGYVETLFGRRRPSPDVKSNNFIIRESAKRAAANMPIQGTEADLMKMAMLKVDEKIVGLGTQVLQIHDSILVECLEENAEKIATILQETMENIYPGLGIKLKVDVSVGKNWGEL